MKTVDYKILPNSSGIYQIKNISNGMIYIGSTVCLRKRKNNHLVFLRSNRHSNGIFQNDFNANGESSYEFSVLEICDKSKLLDREQYYLDNFWIDGK